jgi:hypothetical protein
MMTYVALAGKKRVGCGSPGLSWPKKRKLPVIRGPIFFSRTKQIVVFVRKCYHFIWKKTAKGGCNQHPTGKMTENFIRTLFPSPLYKKSGSFRKIKVVLD